MDKTPQLRPGDWGLFEDGFAIIDFPHDLLAMMRGHVVRRVAALTGAPQENPTADPLADLTGHVTGLSDGDYVEAFRKGRRVFPDDVNNALCRLKKATIIQTT
jgi:hypothetical protein